MNFKTYEEKDDFMARTSSSSIPYGTIYDILGVLFLIFPSHLQLMYCTKMLPPLKLYQLCQISPADIMVFHQINFCLNQHSSQSTLTPINFNPNRVVTELN